ncbi:hypothetical protein SRIM_040995 (plasmid) [Streptomyces rimosus subsp. rimosus ATCC 10970]|uniref:Uncharacterized protein n=3 Tax=Streptomyces rimosus TaxID=1927 RepID=A0A8A1V533_STRR1|nr:hypothetical protein V519_038980 [Streptomyces rimosus R6-500]QST86601.1 hypothetical protein SRIM_040995 [Streptomyces rimosus subsp. rimosus ATCC 10970]QTL84555.1 hypothetical protein FMM49_00960 [Streptomyces rimosus subsp. rimosus]QXV92163.1 hypothetical protein M4018_083650 [Streptomyces rimosus]
MFGGEMMLPVGFEIAIGGYSTEFEDGFGSVETPAGTADIESADDEMRLAAPSMIPVAIGHPSWRGWS